MTSPSSTGSTPGSTSDRTSDRNPIGTRVLVGKGLVAGALADAERLARRRGEGTPATALSGEALSEIACAKTTRPASGPRWQR